MKILFRVARLLTEHVTFLVTCLGRHPPGGEKQSLSVLLKCVDHIGIELAHFKAREGLHDLFVFSGSLST